MQVNVTVALAEGEGVTFKLTAEEVAAAVLAALGADPATDVCTATINRAPDHGAAGAAPPPPEFPPPPDVIVEAAKA